MGQMEEKEEYLKERYCLAVQRIQGIREEETVPAPFCVYFRKMAEFLLQMADLKEKTESGETKQYSLEQWERLNRSLYEDILPENYDTSYGNPEYAVETLGEVHGRILSFLYTELRGLIVYVVEGRLEETTVLLELFIEIYNCFEQETLPEYKAIQQIVYWFVSDYSELFVTGRIREAVDPSLDFATKIIMESDLTDLRYLYQFGEYVSENERKTAEFLNSLSEEEIGSMADTYTEGYRIGFLMG
ncbi:MAG: leucyl aminopeptidase, partial [Candidatus Choladocola sp.]|nr:leucyl aminopeptidase [Candidatus Choladocola sp.]